ncbi:MAG: hypothetical protein OYH76_19190 [Defluviicoccus sp.]|nr:hypothetical protein [Defluviicoccus sp.]MDE0278026.1 hypothetical protein [Defluviicoccus sp.]
MNDLAGALIAAVADLKPGVMLLIGLACYLLALLVFVQGCLRILRHVDTAGAGPSLWSAAASFLIAAGLIWLPGVLAGAGKTFFAGQTPGVATLGYGGRGEDFGELLKALFWIVQVIGLLAFVKGLFVLRGASDGAPGATVSGAAMHLIGGLMAWHILALIAAVQTTLGIRVLTIS